MKDFAIGVIAWFIIIVMGLRFFFDKNPLEYIGKTIIIMNQEYMITDYSFFNCYYHLNNGAKINPSLVEKLIKNTNE